MLCDGNNPILKIVGVERVYWKSGVFDVLARDYSALAFRISGNTTFKRYSVFASERFLQGGICRYGNTCNSFYHLSGRQGAGGLFLSERRKDLQAVFKRSQHLEKQGARLQRLRTFTALYDLRADPRKKHQDKSARAFS